MLATIGKTAGTSYAARDCARTGMAFGHPTHNLVVEREPTFAQKLRRLITGGALCWALVAAPLAYMAVSHAYRATHPAAHVQAGRG